MGAGRKVDIIRIICPFCYIRHLGEIEIAVGYLLRGKLIPETVFSVIFPVDFLVYVDS